jgi:hypothetical protein
MCGRWAVGASVSLGDDGAASCSLTQILLNYLVNAIKFTNEGFVFVNVSIARS